MSIQSLNRCRRSYTPMHMYKRCRVVYVQGSLMLTSTMYASPLL
jgi:hypothetical protein